VGVNDASPRKRALGVRGGLLAAPLLVWLVALVVLPNVILVGYAFCDRDDLGQVVPRLLAGGRRAARGSDVRAHPRAIAVAVGGGDGGLPRDRVPGGLLHRARLRAVARAAALLVMIPFWTSFLVRTYAWMILLRSEGLINALLQYTRLASGPVDLLYTEGAVLIGIVYAYLPFTILPVYASAEKLDGAMIEAAYDLGARPWRAFVRVILPLTRPGIVAGAMFVFIPSIGMFAIADLMGGGRVPLVGNVIQNQFGQGRNWPFGAALGAMLLVLFLGLLAWALRSDGEEALHR
jgi:spermidine/putrescine transport system permease protein